MYLHHLSLQAIGPYPERVDVDFAALAASGVFLLDGPTGSGKSTIIDAVVYALYGKLASAESSDDRLYSQHAALGTEPYVELVFETGAGVHRVRRTPPFDRPKQRGGGTTRQNASARLWRLADPADQVGEPLSDRAQEVGAEIARIVGLDRVQFVQTVVLPQGEFARFLRAPGEDRRVLLQSLFGTQVYERTTEELVARRRAAAASVERADAAVRDALSRFEQASGRADLTEADAPAAEAELVALATDAESARAAALADTTARRADLDRALARTAALERRTDLLGRRDRLDASAPDVGRARARLDVADRASRIVGLLAGLDGATTKLEHRRAEHAAVIERHTAVLRSVRVGVAAGADATELDGFDDADRGTPDRSALVEHAERLRTATAGSRHLVDVERSVPRRRAAIAEAARSAAEHERRIAELDGVLTARPVERAELVTASRTATALASDSDAAERALADATALGNTIVERDAAAAALEAATAELATASTAARAAIAHEAALRERRAAGLAGELGAALDPDAACPVCGSFEHPHVAVPQPDHPTPEDIDAAADARAEADAAQSAAAAEHAVARDTVERLVAAVGDTTPESVLDQLAAARRRITAARAAAAVVARAEQELAAFDVATRALDADRASVGSALVGVRATAAVEQRTLDADLVAVADARRELVSVGAPSDASLEDAIATLDHRAIALTEVVTAAEAVVAGEHDVAERSAEVTRALDEHGFDDADAARSGALDAAEATSLRQRVAADDRERAVVQAGLAEPAVVAAADDSAEAIALPDAQLAAEQAGERLDTATGSAATATHRATTTTACLRELERATAARESTSAESRAVVRLADIATAQSGANPTGITLGSYVLMRRFEDVLAAANSRLGAMLGGRFSLETSSEREAGARRTGLALAVRDHATDRTRDPRSLSGGETFMASLCLALGLADVVQAEAGGVELGTLFVDEGFGTLDPETLDDVIGQLGKLTAGGRQVGIVSHVEELKQRIPDRIEVRRAPGGGSVLTSTVGPTVG